MTVAGVGVGSGRRVGVVARVADPPPPPAADPAPAGTDLAAQVRRLDEASERVRDALTRAAAQADGPAAEILAVTAAMAADPALVDEARRRTLEGSTPQRAVWDAAENVAQGLRALGGLFAERVADVHDVRDRLVAELTGVAPPGIPDPGRPFVLVARELSPAVTARLDPERVLAVVTSGGGPTSHTAIIARSLGIPAVVAAPGADDLADGDQVLVDAGAGLVVVDPDADLVARARAAARRPATLTRPGATADGHRVALLANVGDAAGAAEASAVGAEGIGLFRTELLFLDRATAPTVDEQVAAYRAVLARMPGRRVVVRTLDAGADKPLPFVTDASEPNPALGVRGLRTSWAHPEVLEDQLEAIARATDAEDAEVWVMAPMVADADEARGFAERCAAHGIVQAGVMVEVPAAALRAGDLLAWARFASIGTNDLTQYALAADRELAGLARLSDPWQPAVLDLVALTCAGAAAHGRPVGVCGEAAADPVLALVLVGLGVASLSAAPRVLPDVAAALGAVTLDRCRELASVARAQPTAARAREAVRASLPELDELGL